MLTNHEHRPHPHILAPHLSVDWHAGLLDCCFYDGGSMSKQQDAKAAQGYVPKAIPQTCPNCANFQKEVVEHKSALTGRIWTEDKNLRCDIGGFAVKKTGACREWKAADK